MVKQLCGKCKKPKGVGEQFCSCGRPPMKYDKEMGDLICQELAEGVSLRTACKNHPEFPSISTVFRWLRESEEFRKQYEKAKEESADYLAEEILDIADNGVNDWMEVNDKDNPGYKINGEALQRSRLRVDTRKWIASKLKPKKYGDKILNELAGPDGGPIQTSVILLPQKKIDGAQG